MIKLIHVKQYKYLGGKLTDIGRNVLFIIVVYEKADLHPEPGGYKFFRIGV